jgi:aminoglycoside phosphotransferase (APT) family kinase protein
MLSDAVRSLGLGPGAVVEPARGGASGAAWMVRTPEATYALRLSSAPHTDGRVAAMAAARVAGLPAPELIRRVSSSAGHALLLSWLPGITLQDAVLDDLAGLQRWGRAMGDLQRRLHEIAAPPQLEDARADGGHPFSAGRDLAGVPDGGALLHLDWHPLNLLVDEGRGGISGIVDWDNARRGHPLLDLARTHSLLTVEPSLVALPASVRAYLAEFADAWAEGYGPLARAIPAACHAWAGRVMLADLEPRYDDSPAALDALRRWTDGWEAAARVSTND